MRALVVFESMFGNTRTIAQAVADGLAARGEVVLVEVGAAGAALDGAVDLLVVGAPTHVYGLSRASTREGATKQATGPLVSTGIGLREWLAGLDANAPAVPAAAFDTRFAKPRWLTGSAARSAVRQLRARRHPVLAPPESFLVTGMTGPLVDGELARARAWGEHLADVLAAPGSRRAR
jgi:hypothetical protein